MLKDRHNHHQPIIQHNRALENLNIQHNRASLTVHGEGEQTADQVSVNFINLWSSHTTGLLEPPRWKSEPPHWKCGAASEKGLPDPQKMKIWSQKKKSFPKSIWTWTFCKKNASKLVKFGLCSSISDLQTPIWGHHPMLYFPSQIQRNIVLCYARIN